MIEWAKLFGSKVGMRKVEYSVLFCFERGDLVSRFDRRDWIESTYLNKYHGESLLPWRLQLIPAESSWMAKGEVEVITGFKYLHWSQYSVVVVVVYFTITMVLKSRLTITFTPGGKYGTGANCRLKYHIGASKQLDSFESVHRMAIMHRSIIPILLCLYLKIQSFAKVDSSDWRHLRR